MPPVMPSPLALAHLPCAPAAAAHTQSSSPCCGSGWPMAPGHMMKCCCCCCHQSSWGQPLLMCPAACCLAPGSKRVRCECLGQVYCCRGKGKAVYCSGTPPIHPAPLPSLSSATHQPHPQACHSAVVGTCSSCAAASCALLQGGSLDRRPRPGSWAASSCTPSARHHSCKTQDTVEGSVAFCIPWTLPHRDHTRYLHALHIRMIKAQCPVRRSCLPAKG